MKSKEPKQSFNEIILYPVEGGKYQLALNKDSESIWLNTNQIVELYQSSKQNISLHIINIFKERELELEATVKYYLTVQTEKDRQVQRKIAYYNLEMILAIGYRVHSERGTQFRIWATQHLSEFLKKGFILDNERLKGNDRTADYFDELLAQIREIRASEKRLYQRIRDIFALASDYRSNSETAQVFFASMQNKMLYAATQYTAAEIIHQRADADKTNMGLTNWKGKVVRKQDVGIAKNYLKTEEIDILNRIVNIFLEQAELKVLRKQELLSADWAEYLNKFLKDNELPSLDNPGKASHQAALIHVEAQYLLFEAKRKADIEQEAEKRYLEDLQSSVKLVAARRKKK